jgi:ABC-type dipeptide/oligopeptide/nickel transport system permease subunit
VGQPGGWCWRVCLADFTPPNDRRHRYREPARRAFGRHWLGTEPGGVIFSILPEGGRDIDPRGERAVVIGIGVGLPLGALAGATRWLDEIVMRLSDFAFAFRHCYRGDDPGTWGRGR